MTKYVVEGRRFGDRQELAEAFAQKLANEYGRPVEVCVVTSVSKTMLPRKGDA